MHINFNKTIAAWTWAIPAGPEVCMGFSLHEGSNCKWCYASQGFYTFPSSLKAHADRYNWWVNTPRQERINILVQEIGNKKWFRVFSSGDFHSVADIHDWREICKRCKNTNFWVSTSAWRTKHDKKDVWNALTRLNDLANVNVRLSVGFVDGEHIDSVEMPKELLDRFTRSAITTEGTGCPKQTAGTCKKAGCRACWQPSWPYIEYHVHGKRVGWKKRMKRLKLFPIEQLEEFAV